MQNNVQKINMKQHCERFLCTETGRKIHLVPSTRCVGCLKFIDQQFLWLIPEWTTSMCEELTPYVPHVSPTGSQWSHLIDNCCYCLFPTVCNEVDGTWQETRTSFTLQPSGKQTHRQSWWPCTYKSCAAVACHHSTTTVPLYLCAKKCARTTERFFPKVSACKVSKPSLHRVAELNTLRCYCWQTMATAQGFGLNNNKNGICMPQEDHLVALLEQWQQTQRCNHYTIVVVVAYLRMPNDSPSVQSLWSSSLKSWQFCFMVSVRIFIDGATIKRGKQHSTRTIQQSNDLFSFWSCLW